MNREEESCLGNGCGCLTTIALLGAMWGLWNYGVAPTIERIRVSNTDPAAALNCGTESGPFEVEGEMHLENNRYRRLGGRTLRKTGEAYLETQTDRELLVIGESYKWDDKNHSLTLVVVRNDAEALGVGWKADCK